MEERAKKKKDQVWTNVRYEEPALAELREGLSRRGWSLTAEMTDEVAIAYGQPSVELISEVPAIRWVHLDSAGYDRYDTGGFREMAAGRGLILTNSSSVYAEPCAQHAAALILSLARRLPYACRSQMADQGWPMMQLRRESCLLNDQEVILLGFGAIGRRLVELLGPFGMSISALRRSPSGDESVEVFAEPELKARLAAADHVVNILPSNSSTHRFVNQVLLDSVKPGANFYNIGRGNTVDQDALAGALESGRLAAAFLDVTEPEPLPPGHPLWTAPNCFITPHTAGGHIDERPRLINHFLRNLDSLSSGARMNDRII